MIIRDEIASLQPGVSRERKGRHAEHEGEPQRVCAEPVDEREAIMQAHAGDWNERAR